jgi:hypothetical protein
MKSLCFALSAIASFCADSFGQTVINSVPYTISTPGTYIVGSNFVYPSATGAAISIVISHVTLDLAGHYLYHPPSSPNGTVAPVAISVRNAMNVTIQNGIIEGFIVGVLFSYTGGTTINSGNIVQNLRVTNLFDGIILDGATCSKVTNNQITNAVGHGNTGILIVSAGGNVASENMISGFSVGINGAAETIICSRILLAIAPRL